MKIGLMGLKNSGKTTVFETMIGHSLSKDTIIKEKFLQNHIKVKDKRINILSDIFTPQKTVYPEIVFIDYNNPVNTEKSLTTEYIAKLRECDGLMKIIRQFDNSIYAPVFGEINPYRELEDMDEEIILTDIMAIEKRLEKLKNAKYKLTNIEKNEIKILERFHQLLSDNMFLYQIDMNEQERNICKNYGLLSSKYELIVINIDDNNEIDKKLIELLEKNNRDYIIIPALNEKEINELSEDERIEFARDMGIEEFGIDKAIRTIFYGLNLIMFFTVGKDEVRGWTIKKDTKIVDAAGKIHNDLKRGFIKANVVSYNDFIKYKSLKLCITNGCMRQEGKEYIVQDGDIIEIKFNI